MAIPDFQTIMLPVLSLLGDRADHSLSECVEMIENKFNLTDEDKSVVNESGQRTVYNRTAWATTYLKRFGLLSSVGRGRYTITEKGLEVLSTQPTKLTKKMLTGNNNTGTTHQQTVETDEDFISEHSPDETIGVLIEELNIQLADDVLDLIYANSPAFFEKLVVDLLLKMGYGGFEGAGQATGQTGDGGIDGVIKQDILGLDSIYIQAKRWDRDATVGRPEIQRFVGALAGRNANKGIFITSSKFSSTAIVHSDRLCKEYYNQDCFN